MILCQSPQGLGQGLNSLRDHFFAQSLPLSSSASSSLKDFLFLIKKHSSLYISHITKSPVHVLLLGNPTKKSAVGSRMDGQNSFRLILQSEIRIMWVEEEGRNLTQ